MTKKGLGWASSRLCCLLDREGLHCLKYIWSKHKIYLSKLQIYLSKLQIYLLKLQLYLLKLTNQFVEIAKYICSNCKIYLSKFQNIFVEIAKYICAYEVVTSVIVWPWISVGLHQSETCHNMKVNQIANIFVKIAKYIC